MKISTFSALFLLVSAEYVQSTENANADDKKTSDVATLESTTTTSRSTNSAPEPRTKSKSPNIPSHSNPGNSLGQEAAHPEITSMIPHSTDSTHEPQAGNKSPNTLSDSSNSPTSTNPGSSSTQEAIHSESTSMTPHSTDSTREPQAGNKSPNTLSDSSNSPTSKNPGSSLTPPVVNQMFTSTSSQLSNQSFKTENTDNSTAASTFNKSSNFPSTKNLTIPPLNHTSKPSPSSDLIEQDHADSRQLFVAEPLARDAETSSDQNFVAEKIQHVKNNNTFITSNLTNWLPDKGQLSSIGEPFDVLSIKNWALETTSFLHLNLWYNFTNITAIPMSAMEPKPYTNQFTCTFSNQLQVNLDLLPSDLHIEGIYQVYANESSKPATGPFSFDQYGGQLSYKIPRSNGTGDAMDLHKFGDFVYSEGQVKLKHPCNEQCDVLSTTPGMFNELKAQLLKRIDSKAIENRIEQLYHAFPFMRSCLSTSEKSSKRSYYIINSTIVENYKSFKLELGPIIIKGLDNITRSTILAQRVVKGEEPSFTLAFVTDGLQGQCDWKSFENGKNQTAKHSFTFTIDNISFALDPQFRNRWNINETQIDFGAIDIHRSDKTCPKIHNFTKDILRENLRQIIAASLKEIFYKEYPKISPKLPLLSRRKSKSSISTRKIVYVNVTEGYQPNNDVDVDDSNPSYLKFHTRRVPAICVDKRSWWRRLFGGKKC